MHYMFYNVVGKIEILHISVRLIQGAESFMFVYVIFLQMNSAKEHSALCKLAIKKTKLYILTSIAFAINHHSKISIKPSTIKMYFRE